jgi:hypothetical protein
VRKGPPLLTLAEHPTAWRMEPLVNSKSTQNGYFCLIRPGLKCFNYASKKFFKKHMEEVHHKKCHFSVVRGRPKDPNRERDLLEVLNRF